MGLIIDHTHQSYANLRDLTQEHRYNGAYYYSCEIVRNIIPQIRTDRNWITINRYGAGANHSVVFIHNNKNPENYEWLSRYNDLILVCGVPETCDKVSHLGEAVYLPLSVDVDEVAQFRTRKTRSAAYCGRKSKANNLPNGIDYIMNLPRRALLSEMAKYRKVYAVGRTAIEAKILGCEVLPYDERFPDPDVWQVFDNREVVPILQAHIDRIDGKGKVEKQNT